MTETLPRMAAATASLALCNRPLPVQKPAEYAEYARNALPSDKQYVRLVVESACHLTKLRFSAATHVKAGTASAAACAALNSTCALPHGSHCIFDIDIL